MTLLEHRGRLSAFPLFEQPVGSPQRRLAYEHQETHVSDMRMVQLAEQRKHHVADRELD